MVERLLAAPGSLDEDLELRGHLLLVDEVGEPPRAQRAVELLVRAPRRRSSCCGAAASTPTAGSSC